MENRKGLGRGLASLIRPVMVASEPLPQKVEGGEGKWGVEETSRNDLPHGYSFISVDQIQTNPRQPRHIFEEEALQELSDSIREKGILSPLIVKKGITGFELIAGERRLKAAKRVGLSEVPVLIKEVSEGESLELALIENIQREDLNPIEEASAYQVLIDRFSYSQEEVARKVGKDRTSVTNMLRLLKLPGKVRNLLGEGKITMGHARALLGVPEIERQLYYGDKTVAEGWSVRELESIIALARPLKTGKGDSSRGRGRGNKELSPGLASLVNDMRRALGTQVRLISSGKGDSPKRGKIVIEYYTPDDLDRVYHLIVKTA